MMPRMGFFKPNGAREVHIRPLWRAWRVEQYVWREGLRHLEHTREVFSEERANAVLREYQDSISQKQSYDADTEHLKRVKETIARSEAIWPGIEWSGFPDKSR